MNWGTIYPDSRKEANYVIPPMPHNQRSMMQCINHVTTYAQHEERRAWQLSKHALVLPAVAWCCWVQW